MVRTLDTTATARPQPLARADPTSRLLRGIARESVVVAIAATLVFFWSVTVLALLGNDSWMTMVWGHEVAHHGIPHHDALTVMSHGKTFIDQQWLAQLGFWGVYVVGGMRLALLVAILLLLTPVALGMTLARRRGASPTGLLPFALLPALNYSTILRAQ